MYFRVNGHEVGFNDSIFSGNEQQKVCSTWQKGHRHIGEIKEVRTVRPNSVYVRIMTVLFPYFLYISGFHKTLHRSYTRPGKYLAQLEFYSS